jgi:hypothetical protein
MDLSIRDAILLLRKNGYTVIPPEDDCLVTEDLSIDEYSFERAWDLYQKKVGPKEKLKAKWNKLSLKDRKAAIEHIPLYVQSTPEKQYRKHFQTYLNQRGWEDEIIIHNDRKLTKQEAMRDIACKAAANQANMSPAMDGEVYNPFTTDDGV